MRIINLTAENVKRLKAVSITPTGSTVVIGGKNGQGKTSCLDAIEMALAGAASIPVEPIRRGTERGHVVLELDGLIIERTFTLGGSKLVVRTPDGAKHSSPQAILDKLVGSLSFDPLRFTRMDTREQVKTLRELAGVDTSALDRKRADTYEARTEVGRNVKRYAGALDEAPQHTDAPSVEVSVADLANELDARRKHNAAITKQAERLDALRTQAVSAKDRIAQLEAELLGARELLERVTAEGKELAARHATAETADESAIVERMRNAESLNAKVRANAARAKLVTQLESERAKEEEFTRTIAAIDAEKVALLASAKFAVPGLSFDDGGVKLNGLPFGQASAAEQLRVSVAIGLALNPKLRVMIIRDGSLLDDESMALLAKAAEEASAQLWIEKVSSTGEGCQVVIEDGEVQGASVHEVVGAA